VRVAALAAADLDAVLPLIAAYQRFYETEPDEARNRAFFARFLDPSDAGALLGAWDGDDLVGHACLYYTFSSVEAVDMVLMNDLYVVESRRGAGVGRRLIDATVDVARRRGAGVVRWMTAPDNHRAQRLYDRTGAEASTWLEYEIRVG